MESLTLRFILIHSLESVEKREKRIYGTQSWTARTNNKNRRRKIRIFISKVLSSIWNANVVIDGGTLSLLFSFRRYIINVGNLRTDITKFVCESNNGRNLPTLFRLATIYFANDPNERRVFSRSFNWLKSLYGKLSCWLSVRLRMKIPPNTCLDIQCTHCRNALVSARLLPPAVLTKYTFRESTKFNNS